MPNTRVINWTGKTGRKYKYWIYKIGHGFVRQPGNYIFAKETEPSKWKPIYIGETKDLSTRFDDHHKADCIKREGATAIHVHKGSSTADHRRAEERDLVARWNPPCND